MARPVAADAEATKARILDAAIALVSQRGIDGTTVRDVAAYAKVSLATVLHYFGSKEGLHTAVVAAMDDQLAALRAQLAKALRPGATAEDLIETMVRDAWRFACAHRVAHRIVLRTVLHEGGLPQTRIDSILRPALDDAAGILGSVMGMERRAARLLVQSIVQLSARYAVASEAELCTITETETLSEAEGAVADHLVVLVRALLAAADIPLPAKTAATSSSTSTATP